MFMRKNRIIKSLNLKLSDIAIISVLFAIGIASRFIIHLPNFSPLAPIALFAGVYLPRKISLILPIIILVISDLFLGTYEPVLMVSVYGSFILCSFLGFWLKKYKSWMNIYIISTVCALLFFIITNFVVWLATPWYSKDLTGLFYSYFLALPFFRNNLLGNLFYSTVFFGSYELIIWFVRNNLVVKKIN